MIDKNFLDSIYSDGSELFVTPLLPKKNENVKIKIRFFNNEIVEGVYINVNYFGQTFIATMNFDHKDDVYTYYSYNFKIEQKVFSYFFVLKISAKLYYFTQSGISDFYPNDEHNFKIISDVNYPLWVLNSNFYQIFPDRFFNGNPNNDVYSGEYSLDGAKSIKMNWNDTPKTFREARCLDFYGGDLEGIKKKIPYFKKLGINALYLNPIFLAPSVHKYDCANYFEVDPHFGGNKALINLVKSLHKNDMRIILDVSINHIGTENKWFNKNGLYYKKDDQCALLKTSKYRDFFFFDVNNKALSWFNTGNLIQLNYGNEKLKNIIYKNKNSLVKKYLKKPFNIDGWRFDVASMMARNYKVEYHDFIWNDINKSIKETKNDAYILAEEWADPKDFISYNRWDAVMNYFGFLSPVRNYLGLDDVIVQVNKELKQIKNFANAEILVKRLNSYLSKMPFIYQLLSFNLLDSHDISRLHNFSNIDFKLIKIAAILQYLYIGTPSLYYGDELNIDGRTSDTEGCRYPMPWDKFSSALPTFKLYKTLNHLRLNNDVLQKGSIRLFNSKNIVVFARFNEKECFLGICNSSNEKDSITLDLNLFVPNLTIPEKDLFNKKIRFSQKDNKFTFTLNAKDSYLIKF